MADLLLILALVAINGLLAGAEMSVVSVRLARIRKLAEGGNASARAVLALRDDPERFLATVQVGITLVGATAGAFGGSTFAGDIEPLVRKAPAVERWAPEIAFASVVLVVTYLSVVLGELVPKSLALRASDRFALVAARPMLFLSRAARPLVWVLAASSNAVLRLFGDQTSFTEARVSADEIRHMVEDATRTGDVDATAGDIASRALALAGLDAEDVMIHRRFVVTLPANATIDEARARLVESGHDRAPVVDDRTLETSGYVTIRDVAAAAAAHGSGAPLVKVMRPILFVPESRAAADLLREMQQKQTRIAAVVDDRGGTVGIVTFQDLMEELVGEILGEDESKSSSRIRRAKGGAALVDGIVPVRTVNRELGTSLDADGANLIGGLCVVLAGDRIPDAGEVLVASDGTRLVPVEVSQRRVRLVRVEPVHAGRTR